MLKKKWDDLSSFAHKAKSSFAIMGINSMVEDLKSIELNAKNRESLNNIEEFVRKFEKISMEAIAELDDVVANL